MGDESGNRGVWQLTQEGLESLLAALDEDRDEAARRYGRLRERLIVFFARRGLAGAESLADEVLDRMARRAGGGEKIESPGSYAYGVARFVAQEQARRHLREELAHREFAENRSRTTDTSDEQLLGAALEACLEGHSAEDRAVLVEYYTARGREKIERRRELAARLHLSQGGLRKYTFRLRRRIEECVRARLAGEAGRDKDE